MAENLTTEGFAPLRIKQVVRETCDAVSLVLDVPEDCSHRFRYKAGQFLTLLVSVEGRDLRRCYSMSSAPLEDELRITVKRDPGGVVSNWLNDTATAGSELQAAPPEGKFVLDEGVSATAPLIAFAGGSGITPIMSLVRTVLADSERPVKLFYANRGRSSVIFSDALEQLADAYPDRLTVRHHFDEDAGVVSPETIDSFAGDSAAGHFFICGPTPFMDTVENALLSAGVTKDRLHLERFTVAEIPVDAAETQDTEEVVIELDRKKTVAAYRKGDTLLQVARSAGLRAPYSCETGSCGTCMARIVEGSARMVNNDALDDDEVAEGWVVSCQALPTSPRVHMIYE
ncbi:ferredoxin [Mycolicibacterium duvalii]|nr:ferredoxin--NADP reductase [Mycolicibacterium duvalii]MCV7370024.1 ferredoxin--NADP reductase [Mycolicibacterium duvalii]PEG40767.1 ferredoxin [Mycolicibacterium duvalii]